MLNLFLLTRLLDFASTSYAFYVLKLHELNPVNRFLLNKGLIFFFLWQFLTSFLIYKLAKRYKLLYIAVVIFTLLTIPILIINFALIILTLKGGEII